MQAGYQSAFAAAVHVRRPRVLRLSSIGSACINARIWDCDCWEYHTCSFYVMRSGCNAMLWMG